MWKKKIYRYDLDLMAWWAVAFFLIGFVYLNGAGDWESYYYSASSGDFISESMVANPPYILFLFYPLTFLPIKVAGALLAIINITCIFVSSHITKSKRWLLLLSFPSIIVITFGQLDGLVMFGAVLCLSARQKNNGYLLGISFLMLCLKPQVGLLLSIVVLFEIIREKKYYLVFKAAGVFIAVVLISFVFFGYWLTDWITKIIRIVDSNGSGFSNVSSNISLFPYGLILLFVCITFARNNYPALISCSLLSSPYAGYYSVMAALAFPLPSFIYFMSWLPILIPLKSVMILIPITIISYALFRNLLQQKIFFNLSS